ncbi:PaaI family thioesterase [Aspergillus melleus]|uniref:PaaI family thioesterase n=1 Tax=Aspergillus melleus TaxID=138277 RepID=UPI001E8EEF7C|nr:uncharacterized protein LDX57_011703 [Aspergillus melleus]KAH8434066.1 hypothetical protein LDX57_011703 [Aspergillus melleus]
MHLRIEDFSLEPTPSVTFRFTVTLEMSNINKTMHGGCAITLVDELTTILLAAMSKPGLYSRYGVSKGLRTSFLRPIARGAEVRAVCELTYMGEKQAFLQTRMFEVDGGRLCLLAEHEKVNTDSQAQAKL